jgi:hypothetical protein
MKFLFLFLGFWLWSSPVTESTTSIENVNPKEVADLMCQCGQKNDLPALAEKYKAMTDDLAKRQAKSEMAIAVRNMHTCMDMPTILKEVRALPTHERAQFEDNVMHQLTENCGEVALALQTFR